MGYSFVNPISVFDSQVPSSFIEASVRSLIDCYSRANDTVRKAFPEPVAHDLRPHLRRAEFEKEWELIAKQHPDIRAEFCQNQAKNCWHLRITCGSVILTESLVDQRSRVVRRACFRETYARVNEGFLFPELAPPEPSTNSPLYAILTHDASARDQSAPSLIEIVFPGPSGEVVSTIDLRFRFRHLFSDGHAEATTEVRIDEKLDIGFHPGGRKKRKSV
jgi:hypothetical protein